MDDSCGSLQLNHPFDSAAWKINVPIFYFQGNRDPVTINWQARYHFMNQPKSARFFASVTEGSHNPLTTNLGDCASRIWIEILDRSGAALRDQLNNCSLAVVFESAMAQSN